MELFRLLPACILSDLTIAVSLLRRQESSSFSAHEVDVSAASAWDCSPGVAGELRGSSLPEEAGSNTSKGTPQHGVGELAQKSEGGRQKAPGLSPKSFCVGQHQSSRFK